MIGNRPSALDVTLFCPQPPRLTTGAAGRAAFVSKVQHAIEAKDPEAHRLLCQLTPAEREALAKRSSPSDIVFEDGRCLKYAEAHHEVRVGLDAEFMYCDPDDPEAITAGTADAYWEPLDGTVYVADLKASEYTSKPDSLQLHAYGHAIASKLRVPSYCPGIFAATEGLWAWGDVVEVESFEAEDIRDRLRVAILNTEGPAVLGPHCASCWQRVRCPEYYAPGAAVVGGALEPLAGDLSLMTPDQALQLVQLKAKAEAVLEHADAQLRAWARENGGILDPVSGKIWKASQQNGRESLDVKALREKLGDQVNEFVRRGAPFEVFRWVNAPGYGKKARRK